MNTIHKFPGGKRVIDAMGRDDIPLSWSGIFLDDVEARAREIDQYRTAGEPISLTWRDFSYTVMVTDFQCETRAYHSPYRITCTVLTDDTEGDQNGEPSVLQQIGADLNDALGFNVAGTVSTAISVAQTTATALTVLTGGSAAALSLQGAVGAAQTLNSMATAAANSKIVNSVITTVQNADSAVTGLVDAVSNADLAAAGQAATGYLGRAQINATAGAH